MKGTGACCIEGKRGRCGEVRQMKKEGTCEVLGRLRKEERWWHKLIIVMWTP